jgi:hypothetical protein
VSRSILIKDLSGSTGSLKPLKVITTRKIHDSEKFGDDDKNNKRIGGEAIRADCNRSRS